MCGCVHGMLCLVCVCVCVCVCVRVCVREREERDRNQVDTKKIQSCTYNYTQIIFHFLDYILTAYLVLAYLVSDEEHPLSSLVSMSVILETMQ